MNMRHSRLDKERYATLRLGKKTALTTSRLCITDRRRSSTFYPSFVFQAVIASSVHYETGTATIHERSSPVEDVTALDY
jgi:hypothetical protein